jgi:hypothetical protein
MNSVLKIFWISHPNWNSVSGSTKLGCKFNYLEPIWFGKLFIAKSTDIEVILSREGGYGK